MKNRSNEIRSNEIRIRRELPVFTHFILCQHNFEICQHLFCLLMVFFSSIMFNTNEGLLFDQNILFFDIFPAYRPPFIPFLVTWFFHFFVTLVA